MVVDNYLWIKPKIWMRLFQIMFHNFNRGVWSFAFKI